MQFKVDKFNINIHRLSTPTTKKEDKKRLTAYVNAICELGKKYLQENEDVISAP